MEEHSANGTSSVFSAQRHMEEVVQTPFSPERSSCGGREELRRDLGWRMFGESRRAGERRGEQRGGGNQEGKCLRRELRQMLTAEGRGDRCTAIGGKKGKSEGVRGGVE